jgi:hypothetical protein
MAQKTRDMESVNGTIDLRGNEGAVIELTDGTV